MIAIAPARRAAPPRRRLRLGPRAWVWAGAGAGWLALALLSTPAHARHGDASHGGAGGVAGLAAFAGHWLLMVVAMMWPLTASHVDAVHGQVRRDWRLRAVAATLTATLVVWLAFGLVALATYRACVAPFPRLGPLVWLVAWLHTAAILTRSHRRNQVLRACGTSTSVRISGLPCLTSSFRAGARACAPCLALCGPTMAAMVAPHPFWLLAALSLVSWREQGRPRRWHDPLPPLVAGVSALLLAVLGTGA